MSKEFKQLNDAEMLAIKRLRSKNYSIRAIAQQLGIGFTQVRNVLNNKDNEQ
jgi:IS30 family transposase